MKILQVLPELNLAGAQVMVENLVNRLCEDGYEVEVVSLYTLYTPISKRLEEKGVRIHYLDKKSGFDSRMIIRLREIIHDFKPDIIHTHTYSVKYVYMATRFCGGVRMYHTVHNLAEKETTQANLKLEKRLFCKGIVTPVAISPLVKKSIMDYYDLPEDRVPMIFNGIDLSSCIPKKGYEIDPADIRIIHIGRLMEQKNHVMMIEAMEIVAARYPGVKLHCYGEGPLESEIRGLISSKKLVNHVILEGLTDQPYLELTRSDLFLLPSNWEGMPITLIEAMGTGLPIIVTAVGGIPDMVTDKENCLMCGHTAGSLAEQIITLIENEALRSRLGKNALTSSGNFTAGKMTDAYKKLYTSTIDRVN